MSLLNTKVTAPLAEASYNATFKEYHESAGDKSDYIVVTLEIDDTLVGITREERDCIFPARIDYISRSLQEQWNKSFTTFEEVLKFGKDHAFAVTAKKHKDYGIQFNYR